MSMMFIERMVMSMMFICMRVMSIVAMSVYVLIAMAKYALPWMKLVIAIEVLRISETPTLGWSKAKRNM